jgi:hypothetical protein
MLHSPSLFPSSHQAQTSKLLAESANANAMAESVDELLEDGEGDDDEYEAGGLPINILNDVGSGDGLRKRSAKDGEDTPVCAIYQCNECVT